MDEILTVEEVAAFLKVPPETILGLVERKALKGIQLGAVWRIRRTDLESFFERGGDQEADEADEPSKDSPVAEPVQRGPETVRLYEHLEEFWFPAWRIDRAPNGRYVHLGIPERLWQDWADQVGIMTIALQFAEHRRLGRCIKMGPIGKSDIIAYVDRNDVQAGRQESVTLAVAIAPRHLRGKLMNWYSNIGLLQPEVSTLTCPSCSRYAPTLRDGLSQSVQPVADGKAEVVQQVRCLACQETYTQTLAIRSLLHPV